jgi:hypothetical protein
MRGYGRDARLRRRTNEFTEPVALSSTQPDDLPLPRTAFGLSFDLLALRAPVRGGSYSRRRRQSTPEVIGLAQFASFLGLA